jgi:chromosome segregation ATPase
MRKGSDVGQKRAVIQSQAESDDEDLSAAADTIAADLKSISERLTKFRAALKKRTKRLETKRIDDSRSLQQYQEKYSELITKYNALLETVSIEKKKAVVAVVEVSQPSDAKSKTVEMQCDDARTAERIEGNAHLQQARIEKVMKNICPTCRTYAETLFPLSSAVKDAEKPLKAYIKDLRVAASRNNTFIVHLRVRARPRCISCSNAPC